MSYHSLFVLCPRVGNLKIFRDACKKCHYYKNDRCCYREMYNPLGFGKKE